MLFFKKKKYNEQVMTDEMREKALETRRMQHQIDQMEKKLAMKQQLEGLQEIATGGSGNKMEDMMIAMLMQSFLTPKTQSSGNAMVSQSPPFQVSPEHSTQNLNTAKLLVKSIPKGYIDKIKDFSDNDLIDIKNKILQLSNENK